jgi:hypothetical protein
MSESYPTPPPSPPKAPAATETDALASLASKLQFAGKASLLPIYTDLYSDDPQQKTQQLAMEHLKTGQSSKIRNTVRGVARILTEKTVGEVICRGQEVTFWVDVPALTVPLQPG